MSLKNLILTLNLQSEIASNVLSALNAPTVTVNDPTLYQPSKVRKVLSKAQNDAFSLELTTRAATDPVVADLLAEFRTVGLNFADTDIRGIISGLTLTTPIRNRVLGIGVSQVSPWVNLDRRNVTLTLTEVQAALLLIRKDQLID